VLIDWEYLESDGNNLYNLVQNLNLNFDALHAEATHEQTTKAQATHQIKVECAGMSNRFFHNKNVLSLLFFQIGLLHSPPHMMTHRLCSVLSAPILFLSSRHYLFKQWLICQRPMVCIPQSGYLL